MTTRVKLERWRGHIEKAEAQGVTLAAYARTQGLSRHTLYVARQEMAREAAARGAKAKRRVAPFVAVHVAEAALPALRARLPNGVVVECGVLTAAACPALLKALAEVACSS